MQIFQYDARYGQCDARETDSTFERGWRYWIQQVVIAERR